MRLVASLIIFMALVVLCALSARAYLPLPPGFRIGPPPLGKVYHGIFPGSPGGNEDDVNLGLVTQYEQMTGKHVAWVYFSHNWFQGRLFPQATADWIHAHGSIPFIRLMLRSTTEPGVTETVYTPDNIIAGNFDADLTAWGQAALAYRYPLIVEYGTECNGYWFSWNGQWNGAGQTTGFGNPALADGPERFVAAYRHIVTVIRRTGAKNITWVFHVASADDPDSSDPQYAWNRLENYYPGSDVVDWVGVSVYGPQDPFTNWNPGTFRAQMDTVYPRLAALAGNKPVMVLEFGCAARNPFIPQETWAGDALQDMLTNRWPRVMGFSWWNSHWTNDNDPTHDTDMTLQGNPALASIFHQRLLTYSLKVQTTPVLMR